MPQHYTFQGLIDKVLYTNDKHENLKRVLEFLDPDDSRSYDNWEDEGLAYRAALNCVCSMEIHDIHGVRHKTTGDTLDIGSSCIGKFSPEIKKAAAQRVYRMKHPENKYCDYCESDRALPKKYIEKFEGMDKFYHKKCLEAKFATCEHCNLYKEYTCKCTYFKCLGAGCSKEINHTVVPSWVKRCKYCYYLFKNNQY